jgi:hypothetical protein
MPAANSDENALSCGVRQRIRVISPQAWQRAAGFCSPEADKVWQ